MIIYPSRWINYHLIFCTLYHFIKLTKNSWNQYAKFFVKSIELTENFVEWMISRNIEIKSKEIDVTLKTHTIFVKSVETTNLKVPHCDYKCGICVISWFDYKKLEWKELLLLRLSKSTSLTPVPLSETEIDFSPWSCILMSMFVALASRAFSRSSFSAIPGFKMTCKMKNIRYQSLLLIL